MYIKREQDRYKLPHPRHWALILSQDVPWHARAPECALEGGAGRRRGRYEGRWGSLSRLQEHAGSAAARALGAGVRAVGA